MNTVSRVLFRRREERSSLSSLLGTRWGRTKTHWAQCLKPCSPKPYPARSWCQADTTRTLWRAQICCFWQSTFCWQAEVTWWENSELSRLLSGWRKPVPGVRFWERGPANEPGLKILRNGLRCFVFKPISLRKGRRFVSPNLLQKKLALAIYFFGLRSICCQPVGCLRNCSKQVQPQPWVNLQGRNANPCILRDVARNFLRANSEFRRRSDYSSNLIRFFWCFWHSCPIP